ncbi:MAG TPA: histidinol-phosphate transaminase [Acidobacteriota bacterium]|nr:histidinol-phosphate transaminase [Acidobacteriota bacterium]
MNRNVEGVLSLVRPHILSLKPYQSARDHAREGILLDANENPFPRARGNLALNRYPDPCQKELRKALAEYTETPAECLLAGTGSDEALDWILKVFCNPGTDRIAIVEPTYGMYRVTAEIFDVRVQEFLLNDDFDFDVEDFLSRVEKDVKILFLCSPNNPTGNLLSRSAVETALQEWNGLVVLDEAYIEFSRSESLSPLISHHPRLVVLRTFSKALGRAGARLGYVTAQPEIIRLFMKVKAPYNLSLASQAEGLQALQETDRTRREIRELVAERERLSAELSSIRGVARVYPSQANFILFSCVAAPRACRQLAQMGIIVRDRSSLPRLKNCLRVSVGTHEENSIFIDALKGILDGEGANG